MKKLAPHKPYILGVSGRVGSGKSFAADCLIRHFSGTLIDLDKIGHQLFETPDVVRIMTDCFGSKILTSEGKIDRIRLGILVFNPSDLIPLMQLNAIMHPHILAAAIQRCQKISTGLVVVVGAVLQEIGLRPICQSVLIIDAEDRAIMGQNRGKFLRISPFQKSRQAFLESGDFSIINSFTPPFEDALIQLVQKKVGSHAPPH